MATFCYLRVQGEPGGLRKTLAREVLSAWERAGISAWGLWEGLFGVGSDELLVVAASRMELDASVFTRALDGRSLMVNDRLLMTPAARPVDEGVRPCRKPGLYVFRFFDVALLHVQEFATLSRQAWETFEHADAYAAEPVGLFRQQPGSGEETRMLLVTWYDGLRSWEASRRPHPQAAANFQRRRALTRRTVALATRLRSFPD